MAARPTLPPMAMRLFHLTDAEHYAVWRLGRGDFALGLRYLLGLQTHAPLVAASRRRDLPDEMTRGARRDFPEFIEREDAERLGRWTGAPGERVRCLLDTVWSILPGEKREDLLAQFQQKAHLASGAIAVQRPDGLWYTRGHARGRQAGLASWDEDEG